MRSASAARAASMTTGTGTRASSGPCSANAGTSAAGRQGTTRGEGKAKRQHRKHTGHAPLAHACPQSMTQRPTCVQLTCAGHGQQAEPHERLRAPQVPDVYELKPLSHALGCVGM